MLLQATWTCGTWATMSVSLSWISVLNLLLTFRVCQHLSLAQVCNVMHFLSLVTQVSDACFLALVSRTLTRTLSQGGAPGSEWTVSASEMAAISS